MNKPPQTLQIPPSPDPVPVALDTATTADFEIAVGRHQILNQNSANAGNEPLKPRGSTLSRTGLMTFK